MSTAVSPVAQKASLLGLPLELRDHIYYYYFKADGGYVSDGDKLLQASGQAVQISLMLACRSIASETRHLPFTLNTITFSTIYRPDWRKQAAALNQIAHYHLFLLQGMVLRLGRLLTSDMYEEPSSEYSQYMPIVMEEVSRVSTLSRLSTFGIGHGDDFLDVTTDLLDWEKVLKENYEMEELSDGVFAERYNARYLA